MSSAQKLATATKILSQLLGPDADVDDVCTRMTIVIWVGIGVICLIVGVSDVAWRRRRCRGSNTAHR
ncbi:hypothetical protein GII33_00680 [Gordonia pseudamarae]|uniref:Uncharacterized protein n=1 Tax=Gordonia pseudamarae TaxID=2831662 RepID=A0ABX6ICG0_9ACTN|nr:MULTISPECIES: hypothetical protein [Gordonia]MBD0022842.1 hypothetical protein [Gordonia sp. (in: high G+C Gram-positive bacteria)]QHN24711.1 hypothetical protein GII33_00680 [Gordonia pseudamarae]QHN33642.1 hypothetical protein GII31_00675 [Gordonia pseudamarae]